MIMLRTLLDRLTSWVAERIGGASCPCDMCHAQRRHATDGGRHT